MVQAEDLITINLASRLRTATSITY